MPAPFRGLAFHSQTFRAHGISNASGQRTSEMKTRMRSILPGVAFAVGLALPAGLAAQGKNVNIIHEKTAARLQEIANRSRGALGYCVIDLAGGERFALNEHRVFPQASAIKIAILMEVYKQAGEGKFKLADTRRIGKQDKTGGSGVLVELGDGTVELSIHDLCVLMILVSDNTATNLLLDLVGMDNVNRTLESLGLKQTRVRRRMMNTAASWRGEENLSTPAEAARIMELLFKGEFISRKVCDEILAILKKPKTTNLKSGLPTDVAIATKPGGIAGVVSEWAIVYLKDRPYVVIVMENYGVADDAPAAIKEISRVLHDHFSRLARATTHGAYVEKPKEP
jgi:beta-lactamase class A